MNDAQIIQRLKNMATDAHLSGDEIKGKVLGEAAARLTELSILHHTWHPSIEDVRRGL
jgi:hypothetical protein